MDIAPCRSSFFIVDFQNYIFPGIFAAARPSRVINFDTCIDACDEQGHPRGIGVVCNCTYRFCSKITAFVFALNLQASSWAPFHKGLQLIASFLDTRFAIELRLISIVRLTVTLCETGP